MEKKVNKRERINHLKNKDLELMEGREEEAAIESGGEAWDTHSDAGR